MIAQLTASADADANGGTMRATITLDLSRCERIYIKAAQKALDDAHSQMTATLKEWEESGSS